MATADIAAGHVRIAHGIVEMRWTAVGVTGVGFAMNAPGLADKTVHVVGPTGGTTQVVIEGTNDDTPTGDNWTTLVDPQGNDLDFTNQGVEAILENPKFIRARFPVATGPTVIVTILARG